MHTLETIKLEGYTEAQCKVQALNGVGCPMKEIADKLGIAKSTADTHMKNCKEKEGVGVDKEMTARWICKILGVNYKEFREKVISLTEKPLVMIITSLMVLGSFSTQSNRQERIRINFRRVRIETRQCLYNSREFA